MKHIILTLLVLASTSANAAELSKNEYKLRVVDTSSSGTQTACTKIGDIILQSLKDQGLTNIVAASSTGTNAIGVEGTVWSDDCSVSIIRAK